MKYTYWLHEKEQTDFNNGFEWYEEKQQGLGYQFLHAIKIKLNEIVAHPETFGSREMLLQRSFTEKLSLCNCS